MSQTTRIAISNLIRGPFQGANLDNSEPTIGLLYFDGCPYYREAWIDMLDVLLEECAGPGEELVHARLNAARTARYPNRVSTTVLLPRVRWTGHLSAMVGSLARSVELNSPSKTMTRAIASIFVSAMPECHAGEGAQRRRKIVAVAPEVSTAGVDIVSENDGHPSFRRLTAEGYSIVTL